MRGVSSSVVVAAVMLAVVSVATIWAQRGGVFRGSRDHPAIAYTSGPVDNPIEHLNGQIRDGVVQLRFDDGSGYLPSVLERLDIARESQVAVFSPTSNQANLIASDRPRVIYFRDDVAIAWVPGTQLLEAAVQDARQGAIFYTLEQQAAVHPQFSRDDQCLACHLTWDTLGVPGLQILSTFPLTSDPNAYATGFVSDHRAPIADRWGGWYVTGQHEPFVHMGNVEVTDVDDPNATIGVPREPLESLDGLFDPDRYLTAHSDIVALMVLEHQVHLTNLITRIGWEARRIAFRDEGATSDAEQTALIHEAAVELVDYLLFVDEPPLPTPIRGSTAFAETFAARGPFDRRGRTLRELDLTRRLMRYPCSYMIYTPAFDALPALAKDAVYDRLWEILSGTVTEAPYDRLSAADRRSLIEILRDTKADLPDVFRE